MLGHSNVGEISAGKQRELSRGQCIWDHSPNGVAKQRVAPTLHRGVDRDATNLLQGQNGSERNSSARRGGIAAHLALDGQVSGENDTGVVGANSNVSVLPALVERESAGCPTTQLLVIGRA